MDTNRRTFLAGTGAAAALLIAVATGCAPMPTAPPAPGPNLITNGSFEADAFGRTISGWTVTR
jgi:hypothetical protein